MRAHLDERGPTLREWLARLDFGTIFDTNKRSRLVRSPVVHAANNTSRKRRSSLELANARGRPATFVALAASAYSLLGRLDCLNTVRTRRSRLPTGLGRLCCSGQCENAMTSKLANSPSR
jgi:hypothetical protein